MEQMEDGEDGRNSKLQLELDDAFRTIHEREMHCQELTWEIKKVRESFLIFVFMWRIGIPLPYNSLHVKHS